MNKCRYGDPECPCQDGLLCHYEGPDPWPAPGAPIFPTETDLALCAHCGEALAIAGRLGCLLVGTVKEGSEALEVETVQIHPWCRSMQVLERRDP